MSLITSYATLQTEALNFTARTGDTVLTSALPMLIQLAEGRLKDDVRVRSMTCAGTFTIQQDGETLPTDYGELDAWYHDGPQHYGEIEIVALARLSEKKALLTPTGVPRYASITLDGRRLFFAPEPDTTYSTRLAYYRMLTPLDATENTSNWLLEDHPHIYLYAVAVEIAKYQKDTEQALEWDADLEKRLDNMLLAARRKQYSGRLHGRPRRPIGG